MVGHKLLNGYVYVIYKDDFEEKPEYKIPEPNFSGKLFF
jgi:hypothetical protein